MTAIVHRRARLAGYAPWILRDYLTNQGPATAIVMILIGFMSIMPAISAAMATPAGRVPDAIAWRMLEAVIQPFALLGPFFATNGIIANDRKFAYFRFLFAKPLNPVSYYVSVFLVYGVGLALVTLVLVGLWSWAVRPMFPAELFLVVAIMYVAFGGIGFLLSAAWRYDWLSLVTVLVIASGLWGRFGHVEGPLRLPLYLLPQVHRAGDIYSMVLPDATRTPWGAIIALGGYGAVCFLLGMLVIRKRPLGTT